MPTLRPLTIEDLKRDHWWWGCEEQPKGGYDRKATARYNPKNYVEVFRRQFSALDPANDKDELLLRKVFAVEFVECAWLYEGHRRIFDKLALPPFPKLSLERMHELARRWPVHGVMISRTGADAMKRAGKPWTCVLVARYNLEANDAALVRSFKQFLAAERVRLDMRKRPANKGAKRKPRSWQPWEAWDKKHLANHLLSTSEEKLIKRAEDEVRARASEI